MPNVSRIKCQELGWIMRACTNLAGKDTTSTGNNSNRLGACMDGVKEHNKDTTDIKH